MKPTVVYSPSEYDLIEVGQGALIGGLENHPRGLEGKFVRTSVVVAKNKDGSFETLNTIYKPKEVE